jgi:signal transduction histidine kinase
MKEETDPRINAGHGSLKEYLILFFVLAAFNGFHMWIYTEFANRGLFDTNLPFAVVMMILYVMLTTTLVMASINIVRYFFWNRPIRNLSEAAKKIAGGDFSVRVPPIRRDGKKDYVELMFDDFNKMVEELSTIETLKDDFISNVSHEIKTPLSVIQSYATALQGDTLQQEERKEYAQTIVEATHKLTELVTNILKLNKLENQEIRPETKPFELGEQLRRCAVAFEDIWEKKNISFEAELDEINVCYDESMLEIVWNNLLSNAVKLTNPGGSVFLKAKAEHTTAIISIRDTGCGMTEDAQKHIFDKFYQGDTSHSREGNGLGLALVKKTIDLVDGSISVESSPGQGSTFTVFLSI